MPLVNITSDRKLRARYFVGESRKHPSRMPVGVLWEAVERYTEPGSWVLDPMAGIGTTLFAAVLGRNVVCCELEKRFYDIMALNRDKIASAQPMLGYALGEMAIFCGDALGAGAFHQVDAVITSPPYELALSGGGIAKVGKTDDPGMKDWVYSDKNMAASHGNISAMSGEQHFSGLLRVYRAALSVLMPHGVVVLVVRNVVRGGKVVDLVAKNTALMEELGFRQHDQWCRKVKSFWISMQRQKGVPMPEEEWVTAYRRRSMA